MHKVDNRRRTCLPVFDPCYRPPTDGHRRLPRIQHEQRPQHARSREGRDRARDACERTVSISGDVVVNNAEDSTPGKTKKKLRRVKVGKWRSLSVDGKQRHSSDEETVTKGVTLRLISSHHIYASCFPLRCGASSAKCLLLWHHFLSKMVIRAVS